MKQIVVGTVAAVLVFVGVGCQKKSETSEKQAPAPESQKSEQTGGAILDRTWAVFEVGGTAIAPDTSSKTMQFVLAVSDSSVTGSTGCNRLMGIYMMSADTLVFAHLVTTKMACLTEPAYEQVFLNALDATMRFQVNGDELRLFNGEGKVLAKLRAQ